MKTWAMQWLLFNKSCSLSLLLALLLISPFSLGLVSSFHHRWKDYHVFLPFSLCHPKMSCELGLARTIAFLSTRFTRRHCVHTEWWREMFPPHYLLNVDDGWKQFQLPWIFLKSACLYQQTSVSGSLRNSYSVLQITRLFFFFKGNSKLIQLIAHSRLLPLASIYGRKALVGVLLLF